MKELKTSTATTFSHLLCFRYLLDLIKARPCSSVLGISTSVLLSHWHRHTILRFRCCAWPGAYQDTPIMHTLVCPSSASVSSSVFASVSSCVCVCVSQPTCCLFCMAFISCVGFDRSQKPSGDRSLVVADRLDLWSHSILLRLSLRRQHRFPLSDLRCPSEWMCASVCV